MDTIGLLKQFDREQRIEIEYPGMRKDVLAELVRFVRPAPGMSFITYSHLDPASADESIREQIDYFAQLNQRFSWKLYDHDPQDGLAERLAAHGFASDDAEVVMVLDLQEHPQLLSLAISADIRAITTPEQIDDVVRVEEQVWGGQFGWLKERLSAHIAIPGCVAVYVAYVDDTPASAAWIYFQKGSEFANLYGGSTLAELRGRGLYSALLARRAHDAVARGCRYLVIEPSEMSRPIVTRHGFRPLTAVRDFERPQV
jgi:hypothetical protein